ncbi:MAG TPA: hypothetical protein VG826_01995 [Pirellulales bacterium]|nr:hypothetical protein [Pirellulales bacterium]
MMRLAILALILACEVLLTNMRAQASDNEAKPAEASAKGATVVRFDDEDVNEAPKSFVPVVGNWRLANDDDNRVLVVDGSQWSRGQTAAGIADRARALYGERYAEFLDNVKAFAYFPYAVATSCDDFQQGEIAMRFKTIAGKIDQGAGILFNLKPNGDYLALRANPLENNLVLWKFERGVRTSVEWVKDTPTSSQEWHELKLVVDGAKVQGYIDGKHLLTHTLPSTVSGRVGIWSKADSVVYFDDYTLRPSAP